MGELGAALDEESMGEEDDEEEEGGVEMGGGESQERAVQAPKLHDDLPFRPA